jgi:hypothetical protein
MISPQSRRDRREEELFDLPGDLGKSKILSLSRQFLINGN